MREQRVGSPADGRGFPAEVHGMRPSDHGIEKTGGKEYKTDYKEGAAGRRRAVTEDKGAYRMRVLIIDGQGGGLGRQLVGAVKEYDPGIEVLAVGTNSAATNAMLRAGADQAATGENSVAVASKKADVIMGPVGIVIADSMLGEITPRMAVAVGQSSAKRILIPVNLCDNIVVGVSDASMGKNVQNAVETLARFTQEIR